METTITQNTAMENQTSGEAVKTEKQARVYRPSVDIFSDEKNIYIEGDAPGVDEASLEVSIEKNVLTVFGKTPRPDLDGFTLKYSEYRYRNFKRQFELNADIDANAIEASIKNGVFKIKLPIKIPEVKKITVHSG